MLSQAPTRSGLTAWNIAVGSEPDSFKNNELKLCNFLIKLPFSDREANVFDDEEFCVVCYDAQCEKGLKP